MDKPPPPMQVVQLSARDVKAWRDRHDPMTLVDVRTPGERQVASIDGSRLLDQAFHDELMVMDRDGSNRRTLFPEEGSPGLGPQTPLWAPAPLSDGEGNFVAVIYQGNLYLIDTVTQIAHQVTGDGLMQKIDWK